MTADGTDKKRPWLFISIIASLLLLAGNVVVYLMYQRSSDPEPQVIETKKPATNDVTSLALEQRKRGVEALRKGDYETARLALEASKTLDPGQDDIDALLEVTGKLSGKMKEEASGAAVEAAAKPAPPPEATPDPAPTPAPEPAPKPVVARRERTPPPRSPPRRTRSRSSARSAPPPPKVVKEDGMILVTSKPDGLSVYVDGQLKDITPARISVKPGSHVVELRDGDAAVSRSNVDVSAGGVAVVDEKPKLATKPADGSAQGDLQDDPSLDLVALLDRDKSSDREAARVEPAPDPQESARWTATPSQEQPRLVVYAPGKAASTTRAALTAALPGIRVLVVSRASDLSARTPADAVMAPPSAAKQAGLTTRLRSQSAGNYVLASFRPIPGTSGIADLTIAVVGELDRKAMPAYVQGILKTKSAPNLRRVARSEDLLSSMQLGMAEAILVRAADYPGLKRRTRQSLNEKSYVGGGGALVVAYVDGGRGAAIGAALRKLDAKTQSELGVSKWVVQ